MSNALGRHFLSRCCLKKYRSSCRKPERGEALVMSDFDAATMVSVAEFFSVTGSGVGAFQWQTASIPALIASGLAFSAHPQCYIGHSQ